ncbi:hypothetical protein BLNAU_9041 [Blattamonas nauphoetae]|uniref:Uncharacterized protein n=1 Tax=Blattamonas nauphoetae TaxID=2049346 RepID=A0ABQ9XX57_9EUKA|nr:hypothetical protein BLNAU_9041 [Blattamonas nauphoetae]
MDGDICGAGQRAGVAGVEHRTAGHSASSGIDAEQQAVRSGLQTRPARRERRRGDVFGVCCGRAQRSPGKSENEQRGVLRGGSRVDSAVSGYVLHSSGSNDAEGGERDDEHSAPRWMEEKDTKFGWGDCVEREERRGGSGDGRERVGRCGQRWMRQQKTLSLFLLLCLFGSHLKHS